VSVFHKVTAFVTRVPRAGSAPELLVFRHPRAGVQLPAGSVEPGEAIDAAALREVVEETALEGAALVGKLGEHVLELPETDAIMAQASTLTGWSWVQIPRGLWVSVDAKLCSPEWSYIRYGEFEHHPEPPDRGFELAGWVPSAALCRRVVRHFFHLHYTGVSPADPWEATGEGLVFRPFWTPLALDGSPLHPKQRPWLEQVHVELLSRTRELRASS
jgi:8-oxo-dGTP pyrophosphatase MutT (NUDIX family)